MGTGSDVDGISQDLLASLPTDPFDQLDLARKLAVHAMAARLSTETGTLKQRITEKDNTIFSLQQHISQIEKSLQETTAKLSQALDEQIKLTNEKNILVATVKKLNRESAKRDDGEKTLRRLSLNTSLASVNSNADLDAVSNRFLATNGGGNITSIRPSSETKLPSQSPSEFTIASPSQEECHPESPMGSSVLGAISGSPRWQSTTEPRLSFRLPRSSASHHTAAPNSPPVAPNSSAWGDGKDFFRQARNRLPYEQFSALLVNIKDLNSRRQTKEETLRKADEILGPDNKDLYTTFESLLSCHVTSGV